MSDTANRQSASPPVGPLPFGGVRHGEWSLSSRQGRQLRRAAGQDPGGRRRIRVRQIRHLARDHAPDRLHGRTHHQRRGAVPPSTAARPSISSRRPTTTLREIRGNDIAMIFQEPMTSLNPVFTIGNQIAETLILHEGLNAPRGARRGRRQLLQKVRLPDADKLARPLSAPALRRHAPARDDRHGARLQSEAPDRRRADDGARRDDPGADPQHHPRPAARDGHGRHLHHPRHGRGRRDGRRRGGDVEGREGGAGAGARHLRRAAASLHPRAALRRAAPRQHDGPAAAEAHARDGHRGRRAEARRRHARAGHGRLRQAHPPGRQAHHPLRCRQDLLRPRRRTASMRWRRSASTSIPARRWRWWANPAAASPPSGARCSSSSSRPAARCASTGATWAP